MKKIAALEQACAGLTVCASPTHGHLCLPPSLLIFISRGTQHFTHLDIALTQQAEVGALKYKLLAGQAKAEELEVKVGALQVFVEQQQDEIAAMKAAHEQQEQEREVCASPIGITALPATPSEEGTVLHLDYTLSPAGPVHCMYVSHRPLQVADDDDMETLSPVTPLNPYETPNVKRMAADADLSSGTGLEPCPFEPCPVE